MGEDLFGPPVDHAPELAAFRALDAVGLDEADASAKAESLFQARGEAPAKALHLGRLVEEGEILGDLGLDLDAVGSFLPIDDDPVVGLDAVDLEKGVLDLGREDVHPVDYDHVVDPPGDAAHPREGPAAGAASLQHGGNVPRPEADDGEALLRYGREHELPLLAGGQGPQGLPIDDLQYEVVLVDVEAVPLGALEGDAGADELGQAVIVECLQMEPPLDLFPHRLAPGLGPEEAGTEPKLLGMDAPIPQIRRDADGVARRADEGRGLVVAHDRHLPAQALARRGDHRGADLLGTVMEAEAGRRQVIVEGDLDEVVLGEVGGPQDPGDQGSPDGDVAGRVADDDRLSRGARGRMDPHDVLERHGEHPVGIARPQVLLRREGELRQVAGRLYLLDVHSEAGEALAVEGHVLAGAVEGRLEALYLDLLEVPAVDALVCVGSSHGSSRSSAMDEYSFPR